MDSNAAAVREFRYDVFISYSRKESAFARRLEQELRRYRPPKGLPVPQRHLRVFRDEADFTGAEYHQSLDSNLRDTAKLIVICSPNSASSKFVADEIHRFSEYRGKEHIVPVLLDGVPNNEAQQGHDDRKAFPEQLVQLLPMPLAADFRKFDSKRDKFRAGSFAAAWFKVLADVYATYGVDRAQVEQRESRRRKRRLRTIAAISSSLALTVVALTIWALMSRTEARQQQDNTEARRSEAEARLAFESGDILKATLLSVSSVRHAWTVDGQIALTRFLGLLPRQPAWRQQLPAVGTSGAVGTGGRHGTLAFSPDNTRIASGAGNGPIRILDAQTGRSLASFSFDRRPGDRTVLAFSPDGKLIVSGCAQQACVLDSANGHLITHLPPEQGHRHGDMVWSVSFSPDGLQLAVSSYGSNEVLIYDVGTWRTAAAIRTSATAVFSVAFSPDRKWLVTDGSQNLQLWRVGHYETPAAQARFSGQVWSIAFQSDGRGFLVGSSRDVQMWRIESDSTGAVKLKQGASAMIDAHSVLPFLWRDQSCFAAAANTEVEVLCGEALENVLRLPRSSAAIAISRDGRWLVNEETDGTLAAWPMERVGVDRRVLLGAPIRAMAVAERQGWLAAVTDNELAVIGLDKWQEQTRLRLDRPVATVNVSTDGQWLVSAGDTWVRVFETANWHEATSATYGKVRWAGFEEGRGLLIAADSAVILISPGDWRERLKVDYEGDIEALRVSPDGTKLAVRTRWSTGGHDTGAHLTRVIDLTSGGETGWQYTTGGSNISHAFIEQEAERKHRALEGGDIESVRKSESWRVLDLNEPSKRTSGDGKWQISIGSKLTLQEVASGRPIAEFDHASTINSVRFIPAFAPRWLVSAGDDGTLAVWPILTADLADQACERIRAMLGPDTLKQLLTDTHTERSCK